MFSYYNTIHVSLKLKKKVLLVNIAEFLYTDFFIK